MLLAYEGTPFCGWQRQSDGGKSIQEAIEHALQSITGERTPIIGSGRTDAGVHACGQVAHFDLRLKEWDPLVLRKALNSLLPQSISVIEIKAVSPDFHAQRSAHSKRYSYYYLQGPTDMTFYRPFTRWIQKELSIERMQAASQALIGTHDFKVFCASGSTAKTTVREVLDTRFETIPNGSYSLVRFSIHGRGFLKQMVRSIVGTLTQIGLGQRPVDAIEGLMKSQERSKVGPTAPARGLWLEEVFYPDLKWANQIKNPFTMAPKDGKTI